MCAVFITKIILKIFGRIGRRTSRSMLLMALWLKPPYPPLSPGKDRSVWLLSFNLDGALLN